MSLPYSQLHVYVECHPNKEIRDFHLSIPTYSKPFSRYDEKGLPKKIQRLERKFQMLPQIQNDTIGIVGLKSLRVTLNPAFSWEEAIEAVVKVINGYFKCEALPLVTIMERNSEWDRPRSERDDDGHW